jgi:hypothetical protein
LPSRNISVGTPLKGEITTWRVNTKRAVVRENFAITSPVDIAVKRRLTIDSTTTTTLAAVELGNIACSRSSRHRLHAERKASRNDPLAA